MGVRTRLVTGWAAGDLFAVVAAGFAVVVFLVRATYGLWFRSWADELEHLLGGWALTAGDRLYVDFVDLHGPFIFFLAKSYGSVFGWAQDNYIRVIPAGFLLLAAISVAASACLSSVQERSWSVVVFVGLTTTVWIVQGLYLFEYYLVSGALLTVVLVCYAVPRWRGLPVSRRAAAISGVSAVLAVFTSHAWLPTAGGLFASAVLPLRQQGAGRLVVSFAVAAALTTAACLVWLWKFGSILGYFVFHVVFSHTVYLQTVTPINPELSVGKFILSLVPSLAPDRLAHSLGDVALSCSIGLGAFIYRPWPFTVGIIGILTADARGNDGYQDGTFLILSIALFSLTLAQALRASAMSTVFCLALVAGAEGVMRHAVTSPNRLTRKMIVHDAPVRLNTPLQTPTFSLIRSIVGPEERILALVYRPLDYWFAGRLPMKGFYEYLPHDSLYAGHPVLGVHRDLCEAMSNAPPPIVIFDNWKVWDYYAPKDYMPCVVDLIQAKYVRSGVDLTLFIRRDRVPR